MKHCTVTILFVFIVSVKWLFGQEPKLVLPIGHTKPVNYVEFSPDGKKIVTASEDKTAKIWDVETGAVLADLKGHHYAVKAAQFSADGKKVVTASDDSTAKIWDALTGELLIDIKGHRGPVSSAQFSPDGKKVVTASEDSTAKIWDVSTGKLLLQLKRHKGLVLFAQFNPDQTKIVTASEDGTAVIWDAENGKPLNVLSGHKDMVGSARFSPDGKKIITASFDGTAKIWDAASGSLVFDLKGHKKEVTAAEYSPDGKKVVTASADFTAKEWDAATGKLLNNLKAHDAAVISATFSADSKKIVTGSDDATAEEWDATTGEPLAELIHGSQVNYAQFSPDGKKIVTASSDNSAIIWDEASLRPLVDLLGHSNYVSAVEFSPDGKEIITSSFDGSVRTWDTYTGRLLNSLKAHNQFVNYAEYSPVSVADSTWGNMFVTASSDSTAKIWDNYTGKNLAVLKGHKDIVMTARFSPTGRKIVTASLDKTAKIWGPNSAKWLADLRGHTSAILSAEFSPDGKKVVTASGDKTAKIWNATTGQLMLTLKGHYAAVNSAQFSPDGKKIVTASDDLSVGIWNALTGTSLAFLEGHSDNVVSAKFSPDGKRIVTASWDNTAKVWDAVTGKLIFTLAGHDGDVTNATFSPASDDPKGGKRIVTSSSDNTCKVWNAETGALLYTFMSIDSVDYLVVDKDNHYDGSQAAMKLLYFNFQGEVIELSQLKDQLWVPGLAERINKGESIDAKTLKEINVFNLTPDVEEISSSADQYRFAVKVRKGGLGETVVFVNGIEARRYKPDQLRNNNGVYELVINKAELKDFFVAGKQNPVTVKTYTADNTIASRGVVVQADETKTSTTRPNLYAVMIGISDYKGDELDLKYAAKDATDVSTAIGNTSRKLLNTDDKEHVFMYNLTTNKERYQLPEKRSIQKLLEDIGQRATANDILLIFFAGHGIMTGDADKKQFYFLTADASTLSSTDAVKDVGISTTELADWISPQKIKAQKRVLIFDACNSGQAIKDFVKMGSENENYLAARNDDKSQQVKAIDKLNEKSGLFILSASASNQSAYEMGRYSQGLLTYSLLKAIKQQSDILSEGKFLDISRWFNAAEKTVAEVSKESGARQEPQIVTNTNFAIGIVDQDVMSKIVLPEEKPLFAGSNFQNADENISADDMGFNKLLNEQLNELSSHGANATITYIQGSDSPDAYTLNGRYTVAGNAVSLKIFIRQKNEVKQKIDLTGSRDKLNELAVLAATKATQWAGSAKQ